MEETLLLSIKTKYANKIFNGTKKYEYRRKSIGTKNINKKIFIYSSEEDRAIIGYIIVDKILEGNIDYILNTTNCSDDISSYFDGCDKCYALHILKFKRLERPIYLKEIKDKNEKFIVPQFYRYIKKDEYIYNRLKEMNVI